MAATLRTQTDIATPPLLAPSGGIPNCRVPKAQNGHEDPHSAAARRGELPPAAWRCGLSLGVRLRNRGVCTYILGSILATNQDLSRARKGAEARTLRGRREEPRLSATHSCKTGPARA